MAPIPIGKKSEGGYQTPGWNCYACQDTGIVPDYLVRMIQGYEDYNCQTHKNLLCTCNARVKWTNLRDCFDLSLTENQRQWFHDYRHKDWVESMEAMAKKDPKHRAMVESIQGYTHQ